MQLTALGWQAVTGNRRGRETGRLWRPPQELIFLRSPAHETPTNTLLAAETGYTGRLCKVSLKRPRRRSC